MLEPYRPDMAYVPEGPATLAVQDVGMHGVAIACADEECVESSIEAVVERWMPDAYPPIVLMSGWLVLPVSVN